MVKNLPANAGDIGSIPALRRLHMPRGNEVHASKLLSLCAATTEAHTLELVLCNKKPLHWEAHALQLKSSAHLLQLEKAYAQQWRPSTAKK